MSELKNKSSGVTTIKWIALCFFVALLIAAAIPNFIAPRINYATPACINNLRQISAAANQFAVANHLTKGDRVDFPNDLTPYIKLNSQGKIPGCPGGGIYFIKKVGETPTCSLGTTVAPAHVLP